MLLPFRDRNPSKRRPYVTYGLIAANVLVFLGYWPMLDDYQATRLFHWNWALIPHAVLNGDQLVGIGSSMFIHAGILHLLFNMLALHIYGDNLEDTLGHFPFLIFYLACGLASAATHIAANPYSFVPTVGASGAVAGVMGGYLLMFPKARIDIFLFLLITYRVFSLSAWLVLGIWMFFQLRGVAAGSEASGIAYWAHIGGFVAGLVFVLPAWLRRGGTRFWKTAAERRRTANRRPGPWEASGPWGNAPAVRRRRIKDD